VRLRAALPVDSPAMTGTANDRFYALDLFRFIAAFSVLGYHWNWVVPDDLKRMLLYPEQWFRYGGILGVMFFFVISGFVILRSAQGSSPLHFAGSRAIRLYPAFWVCCTITFVLLDPWLFFWRNYLVNLTMFPEPLGAFPVDEAYWTLVLEAKFYLMIWLLLFTRSLKHIEWVLWFWLGYSQLPDWIIVRDLMAASPELQKLISLIFDTGNGAKSFSTYAPFFIGGCACCLLADRLTLARGLLLVAAMIAASFEASELARRAASLYQYRPVTIVTMVALSFFVLVLAIARRWVVLPPSKTLVMLGAMSYPLYLLNMYIGSHFLSGFAETIPQPWLYLLLLAGVLGLCWCVVVFAEAPMQAWMRAKLHWLEHALERRRPPDLNTSS
jgi:peptidoglycan/LPS O-acetylase OafA/YrhL